MVSMTVHISTEAIYWVSHCAVEIISTSSYRELSTICCFLGCIIGGNNSLEYICSDPRQHCFDHGTGTPAYLGDIWDWLIVRLRFTLLYVIFRLLDSNLKVTFELWLVRVCRGLFHTCSRSTSLRFTVVDVSIKAVSNSYRDK